MNHYSYDCGKAFFYGLFLAATIVFLPYGFGDGPEGLPGTIVFSSDRTGAWRIWKIGADGSGLAQISEAGDDAQDVDPVTSPDGKRILFSSTRGGQTGIWIMSAGGENPERVCDGDQADWGPKGKLIVFRRAGQILTRNLESGEEQILTPEDWLHCSGPSFSPDGKTIAFACRWDAGNGIFIIDSRGGEPQKVYDKQGACEPRWSPDGTLLVYETETNLCTIQPDGKKNRPVTYFGGIQRYGQWSPDGKYLVYCQGVSEAGPWELFIIPSKGGTPIRLTEEGSDMNPDWH